MKLARPRQSRKGESTIALINIVFLMLIFFLIAGTLAPPMDPGVSLIATDEAEAAEPPDALFVTAQGVLRARGVDTSVEAFMSGLSEKDAGAVKLAADRDLPADRLIDIIGELRAAGAASVSVVTERSMQ